MIDMADFLPGITRLAIASRQAVDEATFVVYHEALGHDVDSDEWEAFTLRCVQTDRFPTWFPRVSEIRDALHESRGATPLMAEAVAAYERVLAAGTYAPEGGTSWNYREVARRCGTAAAVAFQAAGGHAAFETTYFEQKRRAAFVEEYVQAARERPESRLLPAAEPRALIGAR